MIGYIEEQYKFPESDQRITIIVEHQTESVITLNEYFRLRNGFVSCKQATVVDILVDGKTVEEVDLSDPVFKMKGWRIEKLSRGMILDSTMATGYLLRIRHIRREDFEIDKQSIPTFEKIFESYRPFVDYLMKNASQYTLSFPEGGKFVREGEQTPDRASLVYLKDGEKRGKVQIDIHRPTGGSIVSLECFTKRGKISLFTKYKHGFFREKIFVDPETIVERMRDRQGNIKEAEYRRYPSMEKCGTWFTANSTTVYQKGKKVREETRFDDGEMESETEFDENELVVRQRKFFCPEPLFPEFIDQKDRTSLYEETNCGTNGIRYTRMYRRDGTLYCTAFSRPANDRTSLQIIGKVTFYGTRPRSNDEPREDDNQEITIDVGKND